MSIALQNVIVTVIALGALGLLVRRLLGFPRAAAGTPGCPSCASGETCAPHPAGRPEPETRPLVLVRSSRPTRR